ncbi:MAG: YbeD family protein [Gammaproteobacteria bacterium]
MGRAEEGFDLMIFGIVRRHSPGLGEAAVKSRLSTGGRYMAVTVTIEAMSQGQLDAHLPGTQQSRARHDGAIAGCGRNG